MISEIATKKVLGNLEKTGNPSVETSTIEKLAPVPVFTAGGLKISALVENIPLSEEHARFISAPEFKELKIEDSPDCHGVRIEINGKQFDISIPEGSFIDQIGVRNLIAYAMQPAIEQFIQIRREALATNSSPKLELLNDRRFPSGLVLCCPMSVFHKLLSKLEDVVFDQLPEGTNLTAKRVDYLIGDQYVPGKLTDLPLVGGVSDVMFKHNLGEDVKREDWVRVADDVMVVVPLAIAPLLPLTGGLAIAAWTGASAAFGAISHGLTKAAEGGESGHILESAGKGALIGAVTGLAGGAAVAKVMPFISNRLLAHAAVDGLTSTAATTTEATLHIIEKGENIEAAAKRIGTAAIEGFTGGGFEAAARFGAEKIVGKLANIRIAKSLVNEGIERGGMKELLKKARSGDYCEKMTDSRFRGIEKMANSLADVPGVEKNLKIMAGKNYQAGRGAYTELGAAKAFKEAGHNVVSIGKVVTIPNLGKTDIDILTKSGKWIEKKHVQKISLNDEFRTKIDKMAEAVKTKLEVGIGDDTLIQIKDAIFVNSKKISPRAIEYAEGKGVKIFQKTPFTRLPV